MDDRKVVDLSDKRAESNRRRRKAALDRLKPAPWVFAWVIFLAVAVLGYFWSDAPSRFQKAPPTMTD